MIAILSDIHANLEALEAVLADIAKYPVKAIYWLGDVIGWGPDPIECLQIAQHWPLVLHGGCEDWITCEGDLEGFGSAMARRSMLRTRAQLKGHPQGPALSLFLWKCPIRYDAGNVTLVHGSPERPFYDYLYPEEIIYNLPRMERMASLFRQTLFCGHTRIPGIFFRPKLEPSWQHMAPVDCLFRFPIPAVGDEKFIFNVGSVGQPADGDPRSSYVLYSPDEVQFRRVEYDIERTVAKLMKLPDGEFFANRLRHAR